MIRSKMLVILMNILDVGVDYVGGIESNDGFDLSSEVGWVSNKEIDFVEDRVGKV